MRFIGTLCLSFVWTCLFAQPNFENVDKKYDSQIGAITFHYPGRYFSYPLVTMNSNEILKLTFDDFSPDLRYFSYRILHCNQDWTVSDIPVLNYLDGYETDEIENNNLSFNTRAEYTSHTLFVPNQNMQLKLSGNYILQVWNDDTNEPVLSRRFMVVENRVRVIPQIQAPAVVDKRRSHQQLRFNVSMDNYPISNPEREVSANILQNGRWLDARKDIKPRYSRGEVIDFDYVGDFLFEGGNEFRLFDTRSLKFAGPQIFNIEYYTDGFVVKMNRDLPRFRMPYANYSDLNGEFAVVNGDDPRTAMRGRTSGIDSTANIQAQLQTAETERLEENALTADYCTVEFFLEKSYELYDRDVYILGAFNAWQLTEENKMEYRENGYYGEIELKQGLVDYLYVTTPKGKKNIDIGEIEGSFFETRNDYLVLIYQRSPIDQHDRIIGHKIFSSFN